MSLALGFNQELPEADPTLDPTLGEVASAAFDLGANDRITNVLIRSNKIDDLNNSGNRLSPKELNAQFPDLGADRPLTISAARFIDSFNKEKKAKEEIIGKASNSFFKGTVVPFVAGSVSSTIDPIDAAVGFGVGAGFGFAAKFGTTATRKFGLEIAENAVANTIAEGFVAKEAGERFEEYTADQFVTNVLGGSIISASAFRGFGAVAKEAHSGFKTIQKLGPKMSDAVYRMSNVLESQDISSMRVMEDFFTPILDKFKKRSDIDSEVDQTFNGKVETGEDLIDTYKNVGDAYREGKIDDSELNKFLDKSEELGVDPRIVQTIDDKKSFEFNEEEIDQFNQIADSHRRDQNDEILNQEKQADTYDGIKAQEDLKVSADELIASNPDNPVFKEVKQNLSTIQKTEDLLREFHNCRRS